MFERLFGETEEEQVQYLQKKIMISLGFLAVDAVLFLVLGAGGISVLALYVWGWGALKAMFGFTTLGVIFGRNVVLAAILIVAFLLIGYLAGVVTMLLGIGRFIYLKVKHGKAEG